MIGMACQFRRSQHKVIHPEIERWVKREVSDKKLRDSLFMYYHLLHGTYIIAQWVHRDHFVDVLNLGCSMSTFDATMAHQFRLRFLCPVSAREVTKQMRSGERRVLKQMQADADNAKTRIGSY